LPQTSNLKRPKASLTSNPQPKKESPARSLAGLSFYICFLIAGDLTLRISALSLELFCFQPSRLLSFPLSFQL